MGADPAAWGPWTNAFVERLRELGWIEGRTVAIEYRWGEGRSDRRDVEIADEFVRLKVDVIVTGLAAGLHSQSTVAATSSARPRRPIDSCFMISAIASA
jgi:hypothetical protein